MRHRGISLGGLSLVLYVEFRAAPDCGRMFHALSLMRKRGEERRLHGAPGQAIEETTADRLSAECIPDVEEQAGNCDKNTCRGAAEQARIAMRNAKRQVSEHPFSTVASAFAAGLIFGILFVRR